MKIPANDAEMRQMEPPLIWDNTMLCQLHECPRKLYFFLRGFDYDTGKTPLYFIWGRAWHEGLLKWYSLPEAEPSTPEFLARKMAARMAAIDLWESEGAVDNPKRRNDTKANLIDKLDSYFEEYPYEEWEFVPMGGEVGWVWPLAPGSPFELGGAMDGYVNWPGRGLFVLENKSTGEYLHSGYIEQFNFSRQITQYFWYLTQLHKGSDEEPYGALVNMATKNKRGPRSKWTTNEFERLLVRKMPYQLDEFVRDVSHELSIFGHYWNDWYWPRHGMKHPATCTGGPGRSPCLYRGICRTPTWLADVNPDNFAGIKLREVAWEPWKRTEEA